MGKGSTCREILKILLVRASNYLILRSDTFDKEEDESLKEVSLTEDEFLNDQLDFASYVLRKGILSQELSQGQPVTETCNIVREAVSALSGFYAANQSAEELKPA